MNLIKYLGKVVKVNLSNGYYYIGSVESATEHELSIIDKSGKWVDISDTMIELIAEVDSSNGI